MNRSAPTRLLWPLAVVLGLLVLGIYGPTTGYELVYFDDTEYVIENTHVHDGFRPSTVAWAFTTDRMGTWHPLTWISHAADWSLYGAQAGGHHATSVLLHALNAVLLLLILYRITGALWPAAFVTFVFAVHPLNVASVAWVASRKGVLSTFFALLTVWAYAHYADQPRTRRYLWVVVAFALGLLAKPVLVTLPLLLLVLDVWPLRRMTWRGRSVGDSRPWREKLPLFAMAAAVGVITLAVRRTGDPVPWHERLAHVPVAYATYLRELFWPVDLATPYPPTTSPSLAVVLASSALIIAISVAAFRVRAEKPYVLAGWLWFIVALGPVIGVVQVGAHPMADRWMYLPMIGVLVGVFWGLDAARLSSAGFRRALTVIGVAVLGVLAFLARAQVATWRDTETLFRHAIEVTEDNRTAHYNLGWYLAREGRAGEAATEYERAIAISPGYFPARHNLAVLLWDEGKDGAAVEATCAALATIGPKEERFRQGLEARLGGSRCPED